jgi:protein phosphatase 2C family protein 2/3
MVRIPFSPFLNELKMCFFYAVGIWDCLTSQQVVDFVRYQVSVGKELSEICEMMCDHCLAPDTSSGAGIGCDNMTVLIVAILNGRTKEEWYSWVTDRVNRKYGYDTPSTPPQLYAQSRLNSFRARQDAIEARERERARQEKKEEEKKEEEKKEEKGKEEGKEGTSFEGLLAGTGLSGFSRILSATGGISFSPGSAGVMSDSGTLMFATNGSDEEDSDEEEETDQSVSSDTLGLGRPKSPDPTKQLKAKLDEFEKDIRKEDGKDDDGDSQMVDAGNSDSPSALQGEAPPPPKPLPNGNASAPVEQLHSQPYGDEPLAVLKAEGLLDSSEDPLVKA